MVCIDDVHLSVCQNFNICLQHVDIDTTFHLEETFWFAWVVCPSICQSVYLSITIVSCLYFFKRLKDFEKVATNINHIETMCGVHITTSLVQGQGKILCDFNMPWGDMFYDKTHLVWGGWWPWPLIFSAWQTCMPS